MDGGGEEEKIFDQEVITGNRQRRGRLGGDGVSGGGVSTDPLNVSEKKEIG
jgi:hypothetical protein